MTSLEAAGYASQVCAALSAVALARRRPAHIPAAVALALLAAANLLDAPILAVLTPYPVEPWQGAARVLVYLDGAAQLGMGAVVAGLMVAVCVSPERRRRAVAIVAGVWLLASTVLAALYPSPLVRGPGLQRVYLAADLIGLFVSIVTLARWARWARGRESPSSAHLVAIGLVFLDLGILLFPYSPWRGSLFADRYDVVQVMIVVVFAALAALQGILWRFSTH
jgi:hypothetical protein